MLVRLVVKRNLEGVHKVVDHQEGAEEEADHQAGEGEQAAPQEAAQGSLTFQWRQTKKSQLDISVIDVVKKVIGYKIVRWWMILLDRENG